MRDLTELNITENGGPVTRPAPARDGYRAFKERWNIDFPPALRTLLAHANGGRWP